MKLINLRLSALVVLAAVLFNACQKVEVTKPLGDRGQTIVKFMTEAGSTGLNYNLANFQIASTPQVLNVIDIRRDVPNEAELNKTMTVIVRDDPAAISAYNIANSTAFIALPTGSYTIDAANPRSGTDYTVTFAPGEFSKQLKISLTNSAALNLNNQYALGLTLVVGTTSTEGRVSFENRTTVVELGPLNKWDGVYQLSGTTLRSGDADKTGAFTPIEMKLITTSGNSVIYGDSQVWADNTAVGIGLPILTIDASNKVTVTNTLTTTPVSNISGSSNYYDPATKTFYLDFTWGGGISSRRATVTLKYLRPR